MEDNFHHWLTTWTPICPDLTGINEHQVYMLIKLVSIAEQRRRQKSQGLNALRCKKLARPDRTVDLIKLYKHKPHYSTWGDLFCWCDNNKNTYLILPVLWWIRNIPISIKKYFDWGDTYEYKELNEQEWTYLRSQFTH